MMARRSFCRPQLVRNGPVYGLATTSRSGSKLAVRYDGEEWRDYIRDAYYPVIRQLSRFGANPMASLKRMAQKAPTSDEDMMFYLDEFVQEHCDRQLVPMVEYFNWGLTTSLGSVSTEEPEFWKKFRDPDKIWDKENPYLRYFLGIEKVWPSGFHEYPDVDRVDAERGGRGFTPREFASKKEAIDRLVSLWEDRRHDPSIWTATIFQRRTDETAKDKRDMKVRILRGFI